MRKLKINFIFSDLSIVIGIILFISGTVQAYKNNEYFYAAGGIYMIVGALAYRSAKKRKIGLLENTKKRLFLEIIVLLFIFITMLSGELSRKIYYNPEAFIISLWVLVAYLYVTLKKTDKPDKEQEKE